MLLCLLSVCPAASRSSPATLSDSAIRLSVSLLLLSSVIKGEESSEGEGRISLRSRGERSATSSLSPPPPPPPGGVLGDTLGMEGEREEEKGGEGGNMGSGKVEGGEREASGDSGSERMMWFVFAGLSSVASSVRMIKGEDPTTSCSGGG